jgi:hypothetical protein
MAAFAGTGKYPKEGPSPLPFLEEFAGRLEETVEGSMSSATLYANYTQFVQESTGMLEARKLANRELAFSKVCCKEFGFH